MSGHNKWSSIKHKKGAADAKRGNLFTKLVREITVSAKSGGGDPDMNPRLRTVIDTSKAANMPADNIKKAILKGTGELPGVSYEEAVYEGYGPGGVAVIVEVTTDNKNRAVASIRKIFSLFSGNMGETGCVAWMFDTKGMITFDSEVGLEDEVMDIALEAGAEDFRAEPGIYEVLTAKEDFEAIKTVFDNKNLKYLGAEVTKVPQNKIKLEGKEADSMLKMMAKLEEHDDIQNIYANFDIDDSIIESFEL
ncbi:MAG: YebC/PmpR family DNA-binding transcriptional regulator [bacterium]|nr:YebC/PmpR family DNA-binding transcriptional regulator [bacterium]